MHLFRKTAPMLRLAVFVCIGISPQSASAQNLVSDSGFEQATRGPYISSQTLGDGWSVTQGKVAVYNNGTYVYEGAQSLAVTDQFNSGTPGTILTGGVSQTVSTAPGQLYTLSFYANATTTNTMTVSFGGLTVFSGFVPATGFGLVAGTDPNAGNFTPFSFMVQAVSSAATLGFQAQSTGSVVVDNVSIISAPEPSLDVALALGTLSLLGLVLRAHRHRPANSSSLPNTDAESPMSHS